MIIESNRGSYMKTAWSVPPIVSPFGRSIWIACCLAVLIAQPSGPRLQVPTYYVDSVLGSDLNSGRSPTAPLKSLDRLIQLYDRLSSGPATLFLAGDHVGAFNLYGTRANIQQWAGHAPARIRGSRDPMGDGCEWTLSSGSTYRCMIGPSRQVGNVCARWATLFASLGRTAGWYRIGSLEGAAMTEDKRYFYNALDGYLYFRDDSIGDPALLVGDDRVLWQDSSLRIGLDVRDRSLTAKHNQPITIAGLTFIHFNTGRGSSYGLIAGGTGHTVVDCSFLDCEVHSLVFSAYPNVGCRALRCVAYGAGAGMIGQLDFPSLFVTHSQPPVSNADVVGSRFIDCTAYCYGLMDSEGAPMDPLDFVSGFFGHTSGYPGSTIDDLEWQGCTTHHFSHRGYNFYCDNTGAVPDPRSWASHPVRAIDCTTFGGAGTLTSNIAFKRCFFDFTSAARFPQLGSGLLTVATGCSTLLESSIIVGNTDMTGRGVYKISTGAQLVRINCTTIELGASRNGSHAIVQVQDRSAGFRLGSSGFRCESYGCLDAFAHQNPLNLYFANDGALNPVSGPDRCYVSDGCWIDGIAPGCMSSNSLVSTPENFRDILDPFAIIDADPGLVEPFSVEPDVAATLLSHSPVHHDLYAPSIHTDLGYNGLSFGGQRGAIQAGPPACPCDFDRNGWVRSEDFFAFLGALFAGDADINLSGATDSEDFFDFLRCFFTPPVGCASVSD